MNTEPTDDVVAISLAYLIAKLDIVVGDPIWAGVQRRFELNEIEECLRTGQEHSQRIQAEEVVDLQTHLARIAYLSRHWRNDGTDPIDVEVDQYASVTLNDGHHRLAAALIRDDKTIYVCLSGFLDVAEDVFGLTLP